MSKTPKWARKFDWWAYDDTGCRWRGRRTSTGKQLVQAWYADCPAWHVAIMDVIDPLDTLIAEAVAQNFSGFTYGQNDRKTESAAG